MYNTLYNRGKKQAAFQNVAHSSTGSRGMGPLFGSLSTTFVNSYLSAAIPKGKNSFPTQQRLSRTGQPDT